MFTTADFIKFRALRMVNVAARFEELITDEANDEVTPEQIFLTAVDDALDQRRANRIDKLFQGAQFPIPKANIAEIDYREGRGINPTRMRRYAVLLVNWGGGCGVGYKQDMTPIGIQGGILVFALRLVYRFRGGWGRES